MIPGNWHQAAIGALLGFIAFCVAVLLRPKKRNRFVSHPSRPMYVVDYSAQYREKVEWLGSRFLLARPINKRCGTQTSI